MIVGKLKSVRFFNTLQLDVAQARLYLTAVGGGQQMRGLCPQLHSFR